MDLMSDIVQDFVNRSRDELELLDHGLSEWWTAPDDPEKLTCLAEILQRLQEMSGLRAFPKLESLFHYGRTLLLAARQLWPHAGFQQIDELQNLIKSCHRRLSEMESRQNDDERSSAATSATRTTEISTPPVRGRRPWRWAAALIGITVATVKLSSWNPSESLPLKVGSTKADDPIEYSKPTPFSKRNIL